MNIFAKNSLQMEIFKTYIQQLSFDGITYSKGSVVDLLKSYNIICQDFPFKKNPKPKDLPTRDWAGEDGLDVYIPDKIPMKSYDVDVIFLYVGTEQNIRTDISNFIDFIYGRIKGKNSDNVKSGRLSIYNEYVGMGRKDVVVSEIDDEIFYCSDADPDAVAKLKIKFTVFDPTTNVTPTYSSGICTQLNFE